MEMDERKKGVSALLVLVLLLSGFSLVSAASPAKLVSGFISNGLAAIFKLLWSMTSTKKTVFLVISGRPMMKFENGYTVETVFDGSKLGIEPFSVEVLPGGQLLVLDSMNSNIYRISLPLSRYSRPKLVAGSVEGYVGHVDGRPREARMNRPKGLTIDDRGNIYVADSLNMAIRKVSDTGLRFPLESHPISHKIPQNPLKCKFPRFTHRGRPIGPFGRWTSGWRADKRAQEGEGEPFGSPVVFVFVRPERKESEGESRTASEQGTEPPASVRAKPPPAPRASIRTPPSRAETPSDPVQTLGRVPQELRLPHSPDQLKPRALIRDPRPTRRLCFRPVRISVTFLPKKKVSSSSSFNSGEFATIWELLEASKQQRKVPKPPKQQFGTFETSWTAAATSEEPWTAAVTSGGAWTAVWNLRRSLDSAWSLDLER
ncbi:hypothetical protein IEQ34_011859 [Dendrobium chrysotoxum]|uniref:NHL repeat-containing protein n=1 Tax=Dendrobium chrysotoxum TaxID=161865 RepID=A0AAV7GBB6_DENCH|nr:hypothetical protein IEQ34_011859 [Dendrobium chrysotoxum]